MSSVVDKLDAGIHSGAMKPKQHPRQLPQIVPCRAHGQLSCSTKHVSYLPSQWRLLRGTDHLGDCNPDEFAQSPMCAAVSA